MESIFAFLFKYRPFVFEKGHFALTAPWSTFGIVAFGLVLMGALSFSYTRVRGKSSWRDRAILASIRGATLAVILFLPFPAQAGAIHRGAAAKFSWNPDR